MQKIYENFHIFHFQKRIASVETICENTVLGIYGGKSLISGYTHTQCDPIFKVGNKFMAI